MLDEMGRRTFCGGALWAVLALLFTGIGSAEEPLAVPVSTWLVEGVVAFEGDVSAKFSLLEGAMLSVHTETAVYCLIPHIVDLQGEHLRFDIYEMVGREGKRDVLRSLGSIEIRGKKAEEVTGLPVLRLEVDVIRESGMTREKLVALRAEVTAKPGPLLRKSDS
jgi:hypothetical protein